MTRPWPRPEPLDAPAREQARAVAAGQWRELWYRRFASVLARRRATVVGLGALGGHAAWRLH